MRPTRETAPATTHFNSAEQLLAGLKRGCFDLILIQLSLPDMDGIELAHSIHQQGYRIPVVFLADGPERAMEAYRAGALQYLVRPLEQPLLYHALKSLPALGRAGRPRPSGKHPVRPSPGAAQRGALCGMRGPRSGDSHNRAGADPQPEHPGAFAWRWPRFCRTTAFCSPTNPLW